MFLIPSRREFKALNSWADFDQALKTFFDEDATPAFAPRIDVKENHNEIVVKADLPGVDKKDINVSVHQGVLSISGTRQREEEKDEQGWHRIERSYGNYRRSLSLPEGAREDKVKAEYKDGVLTVRVAKDEATKPKTISID
jgi:HSP20 family protein